MPIVADATRIREGYAFFAGTIKIRGHNQLYQTFKGGDDREASADDGHAQSVISITPPRGPQDVQA